MASTIRWFSTQYSTCMCALLQTLHWFHSKYETSLHWKWTSGWLLTHCSYLYEISKCITEEHQHIQQSSQNSSSRFHWHPRENCQSFLLPVQNWTKLRNVTPKLSTEETKGEKKKKKGKHDGFCLVGRLQLGGKSWIFLKKPFISEEIVPTEYTGAISKLLVIHDLNPQLTFKILQVWKSLSLSIIPSTTSCRPWITI